eukprot:gene7421-biopygen8403
MSSRTLCALRPPLRRLRRAAPAGRPPARARVGGGVVLLLRRHLAGGKVAYAPASSAGKSWRHRPPHQPPRWRHRPPQQPPRWRHRPPQQPPRWRHRPPQQPPRWRHWRLCGRRPARCAPPKGISIGRALWAGAGEPALCK